ncbi:hypothetical protein ACFV23_50860, partial [Streptomyces sp. NPDC059627]
MASIVRPPRNLSHDRSPRAAPAPPHRRAHRRAAGPRPDITAPPRPATAAPPPAHHRTAPPTPAPPQPRSA